jgi:hypothetical protein
MLLESPEGRSVIMDPRADTMAIGTVTTDEGSFGAIASTYSLYEEADLRDAEEVLFQCVARERARSGLSPPIRQAAPQALVLAVDSIRSQGLPPGAVMDQALARLRLERADLIGGFTFETYAPELFQLPPSLQQPGSLGLSVRATYHRPEGAAWGQLVMFLLLSRV